MTKTTKTPEYETSALLGALGGYDLPPVLQEWLAQTMEAIRTATDGQLLQLYKQLFHEVIQRPAIHAVNASYAEGRTFLKGIVSTFYDQSLSHDEQVTLVQFNLVREQCYVRGLS